MKSFHDGENTLKIFDVKKSTSDTQEVIHAGKEEVFAAAEVATAIKGIKSRKAAGEDEVRPGMLNALTGEGILWLTQVP